MEQWRPVVGYEGAYEVSDIGRVRRIAPGRGATAGRIKEATTKHYGYPVVSMNFMGRRCVVRVYRLVASAFLGPRPEGMAVNHIDGNKENSRVDNLEYLSPKDNARHAIETGLWVPGSHCISRGKKLTSDDVVDIRFRHKAGESHRVLAGRFGVSHTTVGQIVRGEIWAGVS